MQRNIQSFFLKKRKIDSVENVEVGFNDRLANMPGPSGLNSESLVRPIENLNSIEEKTESDLLKNAGDPSSDKGPARKITKYCESKRRAFKASWMSDFPWLHQEINANGGVILKCSACVQFPEIADKSSKLILGYEAPFKVETLKHHGLSKSHIKCKQACAAKENPSESPLVKCLLKLSDETIKHMKILFDTAYYIAYHSKPLNDFEKLIEFSKKHNLISSNNYLNRTSCTLFISFIAQQLREELISEIKNSPCATILIDGSTDSSNQSCVIIYMRYINSDFDVKEAYLCLEPLQSETSEDYLEAICTALNKYDIPYKKAGWLIGLGTDGAASMLGQKNGLAARMKVAFAPSLLAIHCVAHRLQLAVLDACKSVAYVEECEKNIKTLFKFYHYSPKHLRELTKTATALEQKLFKLKDLNAVRWVASKRKTLEALLKSWKPVVVHLDHVATQTDGQKAKGILKFMTDYRFIQFCHFLLDFLNVFKPISEIFQKENILITQVSSTISRAIQKLDNMLATPSQYEQDFIKGYCRVKEEYQGIQLKRVEGDIIFKRNREQMLKKGVDYLVSRFTENDRTTIVENLSVFDTMTWPEGRKLAEFGSNEVEELINYFKDSFNEAIVREKLLDEWYDFKNTVKNLPFRALCKNAMSQSDRFPYLSKLMAIVACTPVSTASCERGFSSMNKIKSSERSKLSSEVTNNLMMISLNGGAVLNYDSLPAIKLWYIKSSGRQALN